jgi:Tfp pilus assembly protein FimT
MKRLLLALSVAALLAWLAMPALASQSRPLDPSVDTQNTILTQSAR